MRDDDLPFAVEEWTDDENAIAEVLARATNALIARGAFEAAVRLRPARRILLRHGSYVIARHVPDPTPSLTRPTPFPGTARVVNLFNPSHKSPPAFRRDDPDRDGG
ncbi:hypothetical protein RA307_10030 [Xanthobacteraceae bacterium Astr-EGSB]|uniref:hypothetical protein n=1 Tax=Astrobacterium formosum TaxID=3069710 RepID=UPI0027ADA442|nr:hypothetical protein [Xanthobacteraceae bacterium Astr-EGSB]